MRSSRARDDMSPRDHEAYTRHPAHHELTAALVPPGLSRRAGVPHERTE